MMKRIVLFVLASVLGLSASADRILLSKAKMIARQYVQAGVEPSLVRPVHERRMVKKQLQGDEAQSYYVFSRGENAGFVIVSGNDNLPELIGYCDHGNFEYDKMPVQLQDMLECYAIAAQRADSLDAAGQQQPAASKVKRKASGTRDIAPLMTSHWHQSGPYNDLCPRLTSNNSLALTGCVATAASQIIYYWRHDLGDRTKYNTPTYSYGDAPVKASYMIPSGTPLKWDLMKDSYNGSEPAEYKKAVATLMATVGMSGWLTYGSSTAGQISDQVNVFSGQFGLNGGVVSWRGNSQTGWEKMIISDLELGRPILYSGVHPTDGGHAVVVDGYRVKDNLFHFNFGWGGQGDGYYTVDEKGMNGFTDYQGMVYQIYPKKANVSVSLSDYGMPFYHKVEHPVRVTVTNHGTLPVSGFYLYCLSGSSRPNSNTSASSLKGKDEETVVMPGESVTLDFEYAPTQTTTFTMYICDAKKNILGQSEQKTVQATDVNMTLEQLWADAGGTSEELTAGGETVKVHHVYNSKKAYLYARLKNGGSTACAPTLKLCYYPYDAETGTFAETAKTKTKSNTTFQPDKASEVVFDLTSLADGTIYKASLEETASANNQSYPIKGCQQTVYFKLVGSDLQIEKNAEEAKVTGHYNAQVFETMATDELVARYDMTHVEGLHSSLVAANPNALFYVNASQQVGGRNVVAEGVCDDLQLTPGYNFQPKEDFVALHAHCRASHAVGEYSTLILPFDCKTPEGVLARRLSEIASTSVGAGDAYNLEMKGCTPYLILSGRPVDFEAAHANVTVKGASTGAEAFKGTWTNLTATSGMWALDHADTQYFNTCTGEVIPALTAYVEASRKIRVYSSDNLAVERKCKALAQAIAKACQMRQEYTCLAHRTYLEQLDSQIARAEHWLQQPTDNDSLTQAMNQMEEAMELVLRNADVRAQNGFVDKTPCIVNPSFEATNPTKGWMRKDANGQSTTSLVKASKTTTSQATFMSGAEGVEVVQINAGGNSISQLVEGLPNGVYQMVVGISADYGQEVEIFAGDRKEKVEASDFGPYYLTDAILDDIAVHDGSLLIGAASVAGNVKVDNFRLYLKEADATGILQPEQPHHGNAMPYVGVYDLSGRRVASTTRMKAGVYIVDGKKIIK